jgi:hypothetical protein
MARRGRIEQEVAVNVTGVKDVREADKLVEGMSGRKAKATVSVETDTRQARRELDAVLEDVRQLDGDTATAVLSIRAAQAQRDLEDVLTDLALVDGSSAEVEVRLSRAAELRDELDRISTAVRDLNGSTAVVNVDTRGATGAVDNITRSAGGANSALANMVGNAAQDVGALGGVAGSAGVAIGQMAEYMADAKLEGERFGSVLSNFAKVAAPILGITATLSIVSGLMAEQAKQAEAARARTERYTEGLRDMASEGLATAKVMRENTDELRRFDIEGQSFGAGVVEGLNDVMRTLPLVGGLFAESTEDVLDVAERAGLSLYDLSKAVTDNDYRWGPFVRTLIEARDAGRITSDEYTALARALDKQRDAVENARQAQRLFNVDLEESNEILRGLRIEQDPFAAYRKYWNQLFADIADGRVDAVETTQVINALADALGKSPSEVLAMGLEKATEIAGDMAGAQREAAAGTDEHTEAARELAQRLRDEALAVMDVQRQVDELGGVFEGMERRSDAMSRVFDLGNAPLEALGDMRDIEQGFRDLVAHIAEQKGRIPNIFDPNDLDAGPFLDRIAALREPIQQEITEAFAAGGAPAAIETANRYIQNLVAALGGKITPEQAAELLGLSNIPAKIQVAVDQASLEAARLTLQLLAGLPGADPIWVASVGLALDAGEISPQAVQYLVNAQLRGAGVTVPSSMDTPEVNAAMGEAQAWLARHGLAIPSSLLPPGNLGEILRRAQLTLAQYQLHIAARVNLIPGIQNLDTGGRAGRGGALAGEGRGPEILNDRYLTTGPTVVPPGTKVTSTRRTAIILRNRGTRGLTAVEASDRVPGGLPRFANGGTVPGAPANITVNVSAGVIGNSFELARTVRRAAVQAQRMLGTRDG